MPRSDQDNGSIFDGLNENAVTIVFGNLLKRYKSVRQALQRTLPKDVQEEVNLSDINSVKMHPSGGSGVGIPDLVIRGYSFVLVIEIKVKKERGLQLAQQEAYVPWTKKAIQDEQTGFVTFLVPAGYHHREKLEAQADGDDQRGRVRILPPIYWNQLVEELGSPEELADELIREFYNHLSERFVPKPVRFSTEEVCLMNSRKTASVILKLIEIVEEVKDRLSSSGFQVRRNAYYYAYHFSSLEGEVYFGIWWEFWAEHSFPLCVNISSKENQSIQAAFRKQYGKQVLRCEDDEELVVGYKLPEPDKDRRKDKDCRKLIDKIVTDIETLLR